MSSSSPVSYHHGEFPPKEFNYSIVLNQLLVATDALARFDQVLKSLHNSEFFLAPLRNQEAVISSRMEGTISTMDEILQFEAESAGDLEQSDGRSDVLETILYSRALKTAQEYLREGRPINGQLIRTIHQLLLSMGRGAKKNPGKYKTEQNYLADRSKRKILFQPIEPENLQEGMDRLFAYLDGHPHPPILRTAIMHLEFEALHPFEDGNGRIGRMLITLFLWNVGLIAQPHFYISAFFEDHKDEYIDTMREVSQTGKWEQWCLFFLRAVEVQAKRNIHTATAIHDLYEEMKPTFAEVLSSKWSVHALDYLFANPVFKNNRFASESKIPQASAKRFSRMLLEKNLIRTVKPAAGSSAATYSFEPLMELVRV